MVFNVSVTVANYQYKKTEHVALVLNCCLQTKVQAVLADPHQTLNKLFSSSTLTTFYQPFFKAKFMITAFCAAEKQQQMPLTKH